MWRSACIQLGHCYEFVDDDIQAAASYARALARARVTGNLKCEVEALYFQASLMPASEHVALFEQGIAQARKANDRALEALGLQLYGATEAKGASASKGLERLTKALQISREIGNKRIEAVTLKSIGEAHLDANNPGGSIEPFEKGLAIYRASGGARMGELHFATGWAGPILSSRSIKNRDRSSRAVSLSSSRSTIQKDVASHSSPSGRCTADSGRARWQFHWPNRGSLLRNVPAIRRRSRSRSEIWLSTTGTPTNQPSSRHSSGLCHSWRRRGTRPNSRTPTWTSVSRSDIGDRAEAANTFRRRSIALRRPVPIPGSASELYARSRGKTLEATS